MNAISVANVAIRQFDNLYSLNDLHKASGSEKRHQPANWLRSQQTIDLIGYLKSEELEPIQKKQGLGTFVCKELVIHYAMWISPSFSLQVIRCFLDTVSGSLKSKTTVDERTGLRQAVSALVGRCGIDYSSAYNMIHQRFGVAAIEDIPAAVLPDAVQYVHELTLRGALDGEVLDRLPETGAYVALSERELSNFATATYYLDWATRQLYDLSEPLKRLGARDKGVAAYTLRMESHSWLKHCRETLQRVQPEMRDAYFREHVAGSLRRMDALMRG